MNEIQIFKNSDFGEIRTVEIDGESWFAGKDVASVLGYVKTTQAIHSNVDSDDSCTVGLIDSIGRTQNTIVINESGLFSLILGSKLESAKKFKRWVTSEVLPALHRKGTYSIPQAEENPMKLLEMQYQAIKYVDQKVDSVKADLEDFKSDIPIFSADERILSDIVRRRAAKCMGGTRSNAFRDKSLRRSVLQLIYGEIHRQLGITSCKFMKRKDFTIAVSVARSWEPDEGTQGRIDMCNAQMNIMIL